MISLVELYRQHNGICWYCGKETWCPALHTKDEARWRFGIQKGLRGSFKALQYRQATREHLTRKADGGRNGRDNIALACKSCNTQRGETPPADWRRERAAQEKAA